MELLAEQVRDVRLIIYDQDAHAHGLLPDAAWRARGNRTVSSVNSRGGTGDWQTSSINSLVEEALYLAYHGARVQDQAFNATLERDFSETLKPIDVNKQADLRLCFWSGRRC